MADKKQIPISDKESLFIEPTEVDECAAHLWPTKGLAKRLVQAMREHHPKGINVCRDCIESAVKDAKEGRQ